jgi:hypothetical protein
MQKTRVSHRTGTRVSFETIRRYTRYERYDYNRSERQNPLVSLSLNRSRTHLVDFASKYSYKSSCLQLWAHMYLLTDLTL